MDLAPSIVITGPESSGKSALTTQLAAHFKAPKVLEYAREYLEKHGPSYNPTDFKKMLAGQHTANQRACQNNRGLVFLDTDLINFAVWADIAFGKRPPELQALLTEPNRHHYLLCYPDLRWQPDPLRESPNQRLEIFKAHQALIQEKGRPFAIVKGTGPERFKNALQSVEKWL